VENLSVEMGDFYLVIIDCLRQDYAEDMFPEMESSEQAIANFAKSLPSHNALLTERKAEEVGTLGAQGKVETDTIATAFSEEGFRTVSVSTNGFFQPNFGFDDFDEHYDFENSVPFNQKRFEEIRHEHGSFRDSAKQLLKESVKNPTLLLDGLVYMHKTRMPKILRDSGLKKALRVMDTGEDEEDHFFAVNLMELHTPRTPPWSWCLLNGYADLPLRDIYIKLRYGRNPNTVRAKSEEKFHRRAYKAARDYTHEKMKRWKDENIGEDDVMVITSDHGELLGEYGLISHCYGCTPEQFNVPFFYSGDIEFGDFVSLDDVYDVLVGNIRSGGDVETKEHAYFYSEENSDIENIWAENQKGYISPEFRQIDFEDSARRFYRPFENEEIEDREPVEIPDVERKENYDPDKEVKERLEKLGYMQ
jgi:hypothetical protein